MRLISGDTGKEQQMAAASCGRLVSTVGVWIGRYNSTLLLNWRKKIWFQLARKIYQAVLQVSVKLGPSLKVLISLYIFSVHRWLLYVLFVVQANSEPQP